MCKAAPKHRGKSIKEQNSAKEFKFESAFKIHN